MSLTTLIILLIILLLLSAFFAASETALMAVNKYQLRHKARAGHAVARLALKLTDRPDRLLGVILIGNTAANIIASSIATIICVQLWGEHAVIAGTIALTFIVLIFSEVSPKTYAAYHSLKLSQWVAWPLYITQLILYPVVVTINTIANAFLFLFGMRHTRKGVDPLSAEELRTIVHESGQKIPENYQNMLLGILDLTEIMVDDIMVPRNEIMAIDLNDDWDDIIKILAHSQHTRLLVYKGSLEDIRGLLHLRTVLNLMTQNRLTMETLCSSLYETYYIPSGTPLNVQLLNFKKRQRRSAVVVDEYGEVQGLVTMEDILEEIVGKFTTSIEDINPEIYPQTDGTYIIDGTINIRELNRELDWSLPVNDAKTLSGLIIERLEMIPKTSLCLWIDDYRIEVMKITDNIIKAVKIIPPKTT